ncbi:bll1605 [Bradyrhizobium diazoefficiens USDA 110]|uniref:Bll1605 protein n=1 Tax=Bradyrhizobium diazoefficiens (strain JCM 10833 / BCRC 13528 / IAM 13628 / NBRC 14792 / USDA 110) TaxID=224911 RepID=Q89U15_BRADU|nr:hypothetical protein [Bradyrhizobium japonicum]PDT55691.1 hypothetical protein CO678_42485 [Bradyrhizobium diazoefficiens]QBP20520.1 hypothetical protein Bdiaspc4_08095 [Bradyrhizobium diazoefficiens]BAC46870.1 bll1605 [Bradyrhizobium diazoefficiens USDA 110]
MPPAGSSASPSARDRRRTAAETQGSSVHESPVRRKPHTRIGKIRQSADLDVLARLRLRVIDPDLKHGKALLEFFSACPGAVSGCKFGLESAIHFKCVTRGRQFTGCCKHFIPIVQ